MADQTTQTARTVTLAEAPSIYRVETFAVAVLDDGSEVRMRNLGDRVEVRAWDQTGTCNPPQLVAIRVGDHVLDLTVRTVEPEWMQRLGEIADDLWQRGDKRTSSALHEIRSVIPGAVARTGGAQ